MRAVFHTLLALGALSATAAAQDLVVLDAGHGGRDPGAVGCGREEADHVLDVVRRMAPLLETAGLRVALTRSDDTFVELRARAAFANDRGARVFVAVHANSNAGAPATGTETWIANGAGATTRNLGAALQRELVAAWGLRDRGVKNGNFTVITATAMPAALTEIGFINNCDRDSAIIGDPNQRQVIARAHAQAIAGHLNAGNVGPDPDPGPATGVLRGVTFEDRGAGLDDPSIRLGGVAVRVAQTGDQVRSADGSGGWDFELPPGTYRVEGTLAGFDPGSRTCDVVANQDNWCSFGLQRAQPPQPDPDMAPPQPDPDMAPPEDPDMAAPAPDQGRPPEGERDQGVPEQDADLPEPEDDLGRPPEGERPEFGVLLDQGPGGLLDNGVKAPGVRRVKQTAGCSAAPGGGGGAPLALATLGLLLGLRRRRWLAAAALCVLPAVGRAHVPEIAAGGELAVDWFDAPVREHLHLMDEVPVAQGPYAHAVLSPDGQHLLLVHRDLHALSVMPAMPGAEPWVLVRGEGVGRHPEWFADGSGVAVRTPDQGLQAVPLRGFALDGAEVVPPRTSRAPLSLRDEAVYWAGRRISPSGDRFFQARASADGQHAVFWGLETGLWLWRAADGRLAALGPGGHPRFDAAGALLVFERTLDEGAALLGGDLFAVDLTDDAWPAVALTNTSDRIELAPSLAGDRLAFVLPDGTVLLGRVR
ncbi:MAG: N-acetylmuramoyl-L-alanine amidase [Myxococcales bacterium]|nr:N-acetylmuramoyl-L-alanine amidase [Myxococcales bacterium]